MSDLHLLGIVGSLRRGSVNAATARAAMAAVPTGVTLDLLDVRDLPLYDGDAEEAGPPAEVTAVVDAVTASDGLILFSPEYNSSLPAVTKNVIDWLSRPPRTWEGTPVTMIATTPGSRAGRSVRDHFDTIMAHQPIRLFDTFGVGGYRDKLDDRGEIGDEATIAELARFLAAFAGFCRDAAAAGHRPPRRPRGGYRSVTPRLVVADVQAQVEFLRAAFGATGELSPGSPAEIRIGDSLLMVSGAEEREPFPAFLHLYVDDADRVYQRAVAAGATTVEEPMDTPYGDRRATVTDPGGNVYQIAHVDDAR